MANIGELLINVVTLQIAKDDDTLWPKWQGVKLTVCMVTVTWIIIPPAKRQCLTQPVIYPELVKPVPFPKFYRVGSPQGQNNRVRVREVGESKRCAVMVQIEVNALSRKGADFQLVLYYKKFTVRFK
jgi:hypothetical protein